MKIYKNQPITSLFHKRQVFLTFNRLNSAVRSSLCAITFLLSLFFLSSCQEQSEKILRVGSNNWVGYSPLFLGRELGAFNETNVRLVELPSASEVIHALRHGNLEGAALTLDEVLMLLEEGMALDIILVMDVSRGADAILAKPDLTSLEHLLGKTIAVEHTAVGALLLDRALREANLTVDDINILGCKFDEHINCFEKADAIVTFEPVRSQILRQGAKILFDSSQIDGEIMDVLVVKKSVVSTQPKGIEKLIDGYFTARQYMKEQPKIAHQTIGKLVGLSDTEVSAAYNGLHLPEKAEIVEILKGHPSKLEKLAERLNRVLLQRKLMIKSVNVSDLSNPYFIELK